MVMVEIRLRPQVKLLGEKLKKKIYNRSLSVVLVYHKPQEQLQFSMSYVIKGSDWIGVTTDHHKPIIKQASGAVSTASDWDVSNFKRHVPGLHA